MRIQLSDDVRDPSAAALGAKRASAAGRRNHRRPIIATRIVIGGREVR
jgi:hypothetical protein